MSKGLTLDDAKSVILSFAESLNFRIPLDYKVRDSWKELYGVDGTAGGGFHSAESVSERGIVTIAAGNHRSKAALQRTLQHEVLGHYLINTYSPMEKKQIIRNIIASENSPSLSPHWEKVKTIYPDVPISIQAEEVYASIAERIDISPPFQLTTDNVSLNASKGVNDNEIAIEDIENSILTRFSLLKDGKIQQKTFPNTDVHSGPYVGSDLERRVTQWRNNHGMDKEIAKPTEPAPRI